MKFKIILIFAILVFSVMPANSDNNVINESINSNSFSDLSRDQMQIIQNNYQKHLPYKQNVIQSDYSTDIPAGPQITGISTDAATEDYSNTYSNPTVISGVLQDGVGNAWSFANVELYYDTDHTIGVAEQVIQTDAVGYFEFTKNYVYGDIGGHTYEVYFPNDEANALRLAGTVKTGNIAVKDKVVASISANPVAVGINQQFTISYTLVNGTGGDIDADSTKGLAVDFIVTTDSTSPVHTSSQVFTNTSVNFVAGVASVLYTAPTANDDYNFTIAVTLSTGVAADPSFQYVDFTGSDRSIDVSVAAKLVFTHSIKINTLLLNTNTFYTRNGSSLVIDGLLDNNGQATNISGLNYEISITGGGSNIPTITGVTDALGAFSNTTSLSLANFPEPTDIIIVISFPNSTNIAPSTSSDTIKVNSVIGSINGLPSLGNGTHIVNTMYWPSGDNTITVSGTVLDNNGFAISTLGVNLNLNDKIKPGLAWGTHVNVYSETTTTDGLGAFSFTLIIPELGFNIEWLTVNITLVDTAKWLQPASPITSEVVTFMYLRNNQIQRVVEQNSSGGYLPVAEGAVGFTFPALLNDTFNSYVINPALNYNISIYDTIFNRPALGLNAKGTISIYDNNDVLFDTLILFDTQVTLANQGSFTVNFGDFLTLALYGSSIIRDGFRYSISITLNEGNQGMVTENYIENYVTYGPDEVAPKISNTVVGNDTGTVNDIKINIKLDTAFSRSDNIRSVLLFYRLSDNTGAVTYADAVFTAIYTQVDIIGSYDIPSTTYSFTIPFSDHGIWVEYYVVIYDLAGWGLLSDGSTNLANDYGWNSNFAYNDTVASQTAPIKLKMGDTSIADVSLEDVVNINGQDISISANVTKGELIVITFDLVDDASGYASVVIHYQIIEYDPDTGEIISTSAVVTVTMVVENVYAGYTRYIYTFNTTEIGMDWFMQLDYSFEYTDTVGNSATTPFISSYIQGNPNVKNTWVNDEVEPQVSFNQTLFTEYNNLNETVLVNPNEWEIYNSTNVLVTYNITDGSGSGIKHVFVVFWNIIEQNGVTTYVLVANITMVLDGIIVQEYSNGTSLQAVNDPVGEYYLLIFEIPENLLISNTNITWTVYVTDVANSVTAVNDVDDTNLDPIRLNIVDKPKPPVISVIITTDENGNVITEFAPGEPVEESGVNAILLIFGFLIGLAGLIVYYQRHNLTEIMARRRRATIAESTLRDLQNEIERLKTEGKYRRAVELVWQGLEQSGREITETPRKYNQTASEYVLFLSDITPVELETLKIISTVYESVRYSKQVPTIDELADAISAFEVTLRAMIQYGSQSRYDEDDDF